MQQQQSVLCKLGTLKKRAAKVAKRPASACGSAEGVATKPDPAVKRTKTRTTATEIEEVSPKQIRSSMPQVTGGIHQVRPVHYKGGVIYTAVKSQQFRALRVRGDNYTEKACSFKVRSPQEAWNDAVAAIDSHHRG